MLKKPAVFLLAIIAVSGCTIPGTGIEIPGIPDFFGPPEIKFENDIIIIKDIKAFSAEIVPGQRTKIIVHVQNQIDSAVEGVSVEMYDYCSGMLKLVEGGNPQSIGTLLGREIREVSWTLEAEENIELMTTCPREGIKVRAAYPFDTISGTTVTFIDEEEMQRRLEEGRYRTIQSEIIRGEGPLKPRITVEDAQPVSTGSKTTVIALQLENLGSGFVKDSRVTTDQIEIRSHTYPSLGDEMKSCIDNLESKELKLIERRTAKIPCEISIPSGAVNKIESSDTIDTTIKGYEYEFRGSVQVTVRPKL